jgi:excisionase family DNA binding protein
MAEKILISPDEGCIALGVGRSTMFKMLASGEIPSIKVGRLRRIPVESLQEWARKQQREQTAGAGQEEAIHSRRE